MPRAAVLIRQQPEYRRDAFCSGLSACGYSVFTNELKWQPGDVLCIWNRFGHYEKMASVAESRGAVVVVAENGYLGRDWLQGKEPSQSWYAISLSKHNTQPIRQGESERWDSFGVDLSPWREGGNEIVVLPQRGIGQMNVAMPRPWGRRYESEIEIQGIPLRFRPHPGKAEKRPLRGDLNNAFAVLTWGSGAAIKALLWGVPCLYAYRAWIAGSAGVYLDDWEGEMPTGDRQSMFTRLAWGMWRVFEIQRGDPFVELI